MACYRPSLSRSPLQFNREGLATRCSQHRPTQLRSLSSSTRSLQPNPSTAAWLTLFSLDGKPHSNHRAGWSVCRGNGGGWPIDRVRSCSGSAVRNETGSADRFEQPSGSGNHCLYIDVATGIQARYGPDLTERELRLRLAALWLDRETMIEAFGWDPEVEGY